MAKKSIFCRSRVGLNVHQIVWYSIHSIGTRKKCFLFPLLNSLLKTIEKINLLILIAFIQILIPP